MLVNSEGYWLLNPDNSEREWGFMFPEGQNQTVKAYFPEEWSSISKGKTGQFESENGMFTYRTVYPVNDALQPLSAGQESAPLINIVKDSSNYFWIILSHIQPEVIKVSVAPATKSAFSGYTWEQPGYG